MVDLGLAIGLRARGFGGCPRPSWRLRLLLLLLLLLLLFLLLLRNGILCGTLRCRTALGRIATHGSCISSFDSAAWRRNDRCFWRRW